MALTPVQLAENLGIAPKVLRQWLRVNFPRPIELKGERWGDLTAEQIVAATLAFGRGR
jgi:hypothetical protein